MTTPIPVTILDIPSYLHPNYFDRLDQTDEAQRSIVATQGIARAAFEQIIRSHRLRRQGPNARTLQNLREFEKFADLKLAEVTRAMDTQRTRTHAAIDEINQSIDHPLQRAARSWVFATEAREHVRGLLSHEARARFITDALVRGDDDSIGAVLGAPAYLSGFTQTESDVIRADFLRARHSDRVKRRELLEWAQEALDKAGSLMVENVNSLIDRPAVRNAEKYEAALRAVEGRQP